MPNQADYIEQNYQQFMEFTASVGSPFQILLGRGIVGLGVLTMSFDRHFTLSR